MQAILYVKDMQSANQLVGIDETATRQHQKLRRELGVEISGALQDSRVEDIVLNPDSVVWVKRMNEGFSPLCRLTPGCAESAIRTVAAIRGTTVNHANPILETELPLDGSRFEALLPPVTRSPVFAIRKRAMKVFSLDDYEASEILTSREDPRNHRRAPQAFPDAVRGFSHKEVISAALAWKLNILLVGSTGSGKTTFANALLLELARIAPHDRIITIEDTTELQCRVANYVDLQAVGEVTMLRCLKACMRLKPSRIIVGEVRGEEAHALLKAWNTGHPGGIATIHADDAEAGLQRMESLVQEATAAPQQLLIGRAISLVAFIDEEPANAAGRKIREVCFVSGYVEGMYKVEYL